VPPLLLLRQRRIEEAAAAAAPHLFSRRGREATVSQIQISGLRAVARAATASAAAAAAGVDVGRRWNSGLRAMARAAMASGFCVCLIACASPLLSCSPLSFLFLAFHRLFSPRTGDHPWLPGLHLATHVEDVALNMVFLLLRLNTP
jgi:hypothetical protein